MSTQAPRLRRAGRLRHRAEDRRLRGQPRLRGRRLRSRRDARRRGERRGVTPNLKTVSAIPLRLRPADGQSPPAVLEVRGEIYMSLSIPSRRLNERGAAEGGQAGRTQSPQRGRRLAPPAEPEHHRRAQLLSIWVYGFGSHRRRRVRRASAEAIAWLRDRGLRTNPHVERLRDDRLGRAASAHEWETGKRQELDYEIDGYRHQGRLDRPAALASARSTTARVGRARSSGRR